MPVIGDLIRAIGQMNDPRFIGIVGKAVLLTLVVLGVLGTILGAGIYTLAAGPFTLPLIGVEVDLPDFLAGGVGVGFALFASVFLMVPVASACVGMFLDEVAEAVEDRYYPGLPPATGLPIGEALVSSAGFLLTVIGVNLLGLVLYLLTGPLAPFVFWALNGYLLGREYAQMVAERRLGRAEARALRKARPFGGWALGLVMAVALTVPIVNLIVPVIGAAAATHRFHRIGGARRA